MTARQLAAAYSVEIGCLDNSCIFGRPGGMGTNGGCRCMPRGGALSYEDSIETRLLVARLARLLRSIAEERSDLDISNDQIRDLRSSHDSPEFLRQLCSWALDESGATSVKRKDAARRACLAAWNARHGGDS